ncbi:MAG TPA: hypothetical protein VFV87_23230 [Pirellulaceae bacterium]|nr:hypothetical protein [Pirellulaceae bacterium]
MGLRHLMQGLGFWTDVFKFSEPSLLRVRLRGDWWLRLAIALGAAGAGTGLLLVLFAINNQPPNPLFTLIGGLVAFVIAAGFLFHGASSAGGRVRVCQEGIQRKRSYAGFGAQMFEEANWPYEAVQQCVIVPGQALGKPFSVLMVGGGGEWELVGIPRKIDLAQLAGFLQSRGVAVSSANFVPQEFTKPINLPLSLLVGALGFLMLLVGSGFYAVRAIGPGQPNVAQAGPDLPQPAAFPAPAPGPAPAPLPAPAPPAPAPNALVEQEDAPPSAPANPFAVPPAATERPQPNPGFGNAAGAANPPPIEQPPAPAIPERPAAPLIRATSAKVGRDTSSGGGKGGSPFRAVSPGGEPLVGLAWSSGNWGGNKLVGRLEPLFNATKPSGFQNSVVAKEGYVVGGMSVEGTDFVRAIQLVFVRVNDDGTLDPADSYASDWIGHPAGQPIEAIDSRGGRVIGIHGRRAAILDAVGLVLAEE